MLVRRRPGGALVTLARVLAVQPKTDVPPYSSPSNPAVLRLAGLA
jgi:hypothetical protein